ncbi:PD-(D/E)XK nuclease family protein [Kitasatospora sp. NPDC007106]|uniref:PD-(D/E)XK nuclease family protein n=1 Tax=Kitasatospora sp. NPDC007106 TaxID=3156914 RepID=UPI003409E6BD
MTIWQPPADTVGDHRLIRTSLPMLREDRHGCGTGIALRARPLVEQTPPRSRRKPIEDFALAPVMAALDTIERQGTSLDAALEQLKLTLRCHPAHLAWAAEAVRHYLDARSAEARARCAAGLPDTCPVRHSWVAVEQLARADRRGATRYERTAWGRRYASADGSCREIWLLSVNSVKDHPAPVIAEAASVAATGHPAVAKFRDINRPADGNTTLPQEVRVVAVGCGDGSHKVVADWSAEQAVLEFAEHTKPVLTQAVEADGLNPGSDCVNCEGLTACSAPLRAPRLLGIGRPRRIRRRRSVSVSDLRTHAECPAKFHLTRVLHLRSAEPESPAIRRGRAIDTWLNYQHSVRRPRGCRGLTLPVALPGLSSEESESALRMIAQHAAVCPLDGLPERDRIEVQPRLAAYDAELDVIVIADPDLLYSESGGWVLRETKTTSRRPWEGRPLLETYPQLSLAVLLMSAGVPGGDLRRSRIELELLYPDGSACEEIEPADPAVVEEARQVIATLAGPWASDESYTATPGEHCAGCEVQRWCSAGRPFDAGAAS